MWFSWKCRFRSWTNKWLLIFFFSSLGFALLLGFANTSHSQYLSPPHTIYIYLCASFMYNILKQNNHYKRHTQVWRTYTRLTVLIKFLNLKHLKRSIYYIQTTYIHNIYNTWHLIYNIYINICKQHKCVYNIIIWYSYESCYYRLASPRPPKYFTHARLYYIYIHIYIFTMFR